MHDAVVDRPVGDGVFCRTEGADAVQRVEVAVVPGARAALGVNVVAEGGAEKGPLQVVGRHGVAGEQAVHVAGVDQAGEGAARVVVEDDGRTEHPEEEAAIAFVGEQIVQLVVIEGEGRFPGQAGAKGELLLVIAAEGEGPVVDVDPLLAILAAPAGHHVAGAQVAKLGDLQLIRLGLDDDAVHARIHRQQPTPLFDLKVLRIDAGGVIALRGDAVGRGGDERHRRRAGQRRLPEIGWNVGGQCECQGCSPFLEL